MDSIFWEEFQPNHSWRGLQHSNAKERRKGIADMVWRIIIFSRVASKPPQQTLR